MAVNPIYRPFFERYAQQHGAECLNIGHVLDCLSSWLYRGRFDRWEFLATIKVYLHRGTVGDMKTEFDRIALKRQGRERLRG